MTTSTSSESSAPSSYTQSHNTGPRAGLGVLFVVFAIALVVGILWYEGAFTPKPRVALVTASSGQYWDLIAKGAQDAAQRYDVRLDLIRPASDEAAQSKAVRGLIGQGYAGVAVSLNDPTRQARLLADVANDTNVVTYDSDTPISRRLCFVGTDNYDAGRMCGQMVREAMPQGGKVIACIGSVDKENGDRRRQGLVDELLERSFERGRPSDPVTAQLKGPKFTVVATLIDNFDPKHATELASESLRDHADVNCYVGLFASNTPAILKALEQANKLGKVQVVGFDANEETLAGIEKGHVYGTIVQDAYNIGYAAVRILADAAHGEPNAIPLYPTSYLRCDPVTKDNLAEMRVAMATRNKPVPRGKATQGETDATTRPTTQSGDADAR
jgi:ribose transport system substrate-binding protein